MNSILYKKKPVVVQAIQWNGNNLEEIMKLTCNSRPNDLINHHYNELIIKTLEGNMRAELYDFIIKGVHGEVYPCKPDIFKKTYERID